MFDQLPAFRLLLFTLIFWLSIHSLCAQSVAEIKVNGNYQNTPITSFFQDIENQHSIHFFYIPSWGDSLKISGLFKEEPFSRVINQILTGTGLTYEQYDQHYLVLMKTAFPDNIERYNERGIRERFIVIGDSIRMQVSVDTTLTGYVRD